MPLVHGVIFRSRVTVLTPIRGADPTPYQCSAILSHILVARTIPLSLGYFKSTGSRGAKLLVPNSKSGVTSEKWSLTRMYGTRIQWEWYTVKLLEEIKLLLERNPTRERLFRRTVFRLWLDILSHDNDNHLIHYVLQHQRVFPEKITKKGVKKVKSIELLGVLRHKKTWLGFQSNFEAFATSSETKESWFIASIEFINGLVDEDMNVSQDDAFLDSVGCAKNPITDKDKQPTMAKIFAEIHALRKEVALVKVDDEIISKLERLVNQIVVNEGNGVAGDGMPIGNADGNHDISIVLHTAVNQGLGVSSNDLMVRINLYHIR
ncbi:hypothetical protein Tco_0344868 [Tanacetum coccineum]